MFRVEHHQKAKIVQFYRTVFPVFQKGENLGKFEARCQPLTCLWAKQSKNNFERPIRKWNLDMNFIQSEYLSYAEHIVKLADTHMPEQVLNIRWHQESRQTRASGRGQLCNIKKWSNKLKQSCAAKGCQKGESLESQDLLLLPRLQLILCGISASPSFIFGTPCFVHADPLESISVLTL